MRPQTILPALLITLVLSSVATSPAKSMPLAKPSAPIALNDHVHKVGDWNGYRRSYGYRRDCYRRGYRSSSYRYRERYRDYGYRGGYDGASYGYRGGYYGRGYGYGGRDRYYDGYDNY